MTTPDQHLIDELYQRLKGEPNDNGHTARTARTTFRADGEIIAKCRGAKNAPKFAAIYDHGDTTGYPSPSEARMALLSILSYRTQDPEQLDRLYRGSALYQQQPRKWERLGRGEISKVLASVSNVYEWPVEKVTNNTNFYSSEYKEGNSDETNPVLLKFCTGRSIVESEPEEIDWVVAPWFAAGAITEVSGQIKAAGKTTFVTHACKKVIDGATFMGGATKRGAVVYFTEQAPTSFRKTIDAAGLDSDDFHVLYWHDARGIPWPELVKAAADHAEQVGASLLVIDVLSRWCGLEGDAENSTGAALEAMAPLKEAAGRGLAVVYLRHDRKSGGDVGQSGRGSSQFGGDADQLIQLSRPTGNDARPTVRVIEALGRFGDETPDKLNIELHNGEYRALGDAAAYARESAMQTVCEVLPTTPGAAIESKEVITRAAEKGCKRTTTADVLKRLTDAKTIVRVGTGKRGDPHRYYKPLLGDEPEPSFYSSESPSSRTDETNTADKTVSEPTVTEHYKGNGNDGSEHPDAVQKDGGVSPSDTALWKGALG